VVIGRSASSLKAIVTSGLFRIRSCTWLLLLVRPHHFGQPEVLKVVQLSIFMVICICRYVAEVDELITPLGGQISLSRERTANILFLVALAATTSFIAYQINPESIPERWASQQSVPNEYEIRLDRGIFHSGKASLLVKSKLDSPKGFAQLSQRLVANYYRGKRLHMSAYLKTEMTRGSARLWWQMIDQEGGVLASEDMSEKPVTGTTGWTKYEFIFDVPHQARDIAFGLIITGKGKVWADDFTIHADDKEVFADSIEMVYGP
jgi:hypothetical protein